MLEIHEYARADDVAGIMRELTRGVNVNQIYGCVHKNMLIYLIRTISAFVVAKRICLYVAFSSNFQLLLLSL